MKKKTIICIFIIIALFAAGCYRRYEPTVPATTPAPTIMATEFVPTEVPSPTPIPKEPENSNISFIETYIDDNIITITLPECFEESETLEIGCIYSAKGYASDSDDGNTYKFDVQRFYQAEDPLTSIDTLLSYDESMETYKYSSDITYKNIMNNMPFGDGVGHISKVTLENCDKYTATIYSQGIYYKFSLYSYGEKDAYDLALKILARIKIDGQKAKEKSDKFAIQMDNGVYTSQKVAGNSIVCPEGWYPAESMYFSINDSILSLMHQDTAATAIVRYYPKSSLTDVNNYEDFCAYVANDLVERGFISTEDIPNSMTLQNQSKRLFTMYPSDIVIIHYNLEYTDAYYCIEMIYSDSEAQVVNQMLNIGQSFVGIGNDLTPR